jgi:hypothetical protein
MLLPCSCHALAMFLPCSCHALAMLLPCSCHALVRARHEHGVFWGGALGAWTRHPISKPFVFDCAFPGGF